jgi:hypothetical protein
MSLHEAIADYGPVLALLGVAATLWVNGGREERRRRRENHARAIRAAVAYLEMPYRIRRRRCEPEQAAAERARLSDDFSEVQVELAACEALLRADPDLEVRDAYKTLVDSLRRDAGGLASEAWRTKPVVSDDQMGLPDVHEALSDVRDAQVACETAMASSTRPWARSTST